MYNEISKSETSLPDFECQQEIFSHIKWGNFSPKNEKKFFKLQDCFKLQKFYVKKYQLSKGALNQIFITNNPEMVNYMLYKPNRNTIDSLLNHGEHKRILRFIKESNKPVFNEIKMLFHASEVDALWYIAENAIPAFSSYDFIMRGCDRIILEIIRTQNLAMREKKAILEFGSHEIVSSLIGYEDNPQYANELKQYRTIRFGSVFAVKRMVAKKKLTFDVENFFLKYAPFEALVAYIKHYGIKNGEAIILNREDKEHILSFLSKNKLSVDGEALLLLRGVHAEIKAYIKTHKLYDVNEVRFFKRGHHKEIMLYMARHRPSVDSQIEVIHRRCNSEINYLVSYHPIDGKAGIALEKCGTPHQIKLWKEFIAA